MSSARISPTAHYTCQVWLQNGLSDPAFATREGATLHKLLRPLNAGSRALGGPTIDGMLLARHRLIDHLLETEIEAGVIGQVIEVAAGLSPRGWRMTRQYPELRYIEADLPGMIARKRAVLSRATPVGPLHETSEVDALADTGATSIGAIAARLDPNVGTAIITEGLINYFPGTAAIGMWRRFGAALAPFPYGIYFSDLSLAADGSGAFAHLFRAALGTFVRGGVYLDFADEAHARAELAASGFTDILLHSPSERRDVIGDVESAGARRVHIVDARRHR
jgi:O-methyltransferase involved in polyketide biosynthesis